MIIDKKTLLKFLQQPTSLKGKLVNTPMRLQPSFSTSRMGGNSGITYTNTIAEVPNWQVPKGHIKEFLFLSEEISKLTPRKLTSQEIDALEGKSFRGTSLLMSIVSLYKWGRVNSFQDLIKSPINKLNLKQTLASPDKSAVSSYANKYLGKDGDKSSFSESLKTQ